MCNRHLCLGLALRCEAVGEASKNTRETLRFCHVACQVHELGFVHNDLRKENLLLVWRDTCLRLVIIDW